MVQVSQGDAGLQPQRTALAWSRTGLALFVNALIVLRAGLVSEEVFIVALGMVLLIAAGLSVVCGTWRVRHLATHGARLGPPTPLIVATMCVAWIACVAGVASIVVTLR